MPHSSAPAIQLEYMNHWIFMSCILTYLFSCFFFRAFSIWFACSFCSQCLKWIVQRLNVPLLLVFEGSLVLIGGDPGVGKSTLVLQVMSNFEAAIWAYGAVPLQRIQKLIICLLHFLSSKWLLPSLFCFFCIKLYF